MRGDSTESRSIDRLPRSLDRKVEHDLSAAAVGFEIFVRGGNFSDWVDAIDNGADKTARDERQNMSDKAARDFCLFFDRSRAQHSANNRGPLPQDEAEIDFRFAAGGCPDAD